MWSILLCLHNPAYTLAARSEKGEGIGGKVSKLCWAAQQGDFSSLAPGWRAMYHALFRRRLGRFWQILVSLIAVLLP